MHIFTRLLTRRLVVITATLAIGGLGLASSASAATFTVNDTNDAALSNSAGTTCASTDTSSGSPTCTLRAAVQAADNLGGASTIILPAGTYTLSIPPSGNQNDPATGDLDITGTTNLTIDGAGQGSTTIDANHIDRAFALEDTGTALTMSGVTIENGTAVTPGNGDCTDTYSGGAIYSNGRLDLTGVTLYDNTASDGNGGAIAVDCDGVDPLTLTDVLLSHDSANDEGGAVYHDDDCDYRVVIDASTFLDDTTTESGGALSDECSSAMSFTGDLFSHDTATEDGGALYLSGCAYTYAVDADEFDDNAAADGGALFTYCSVTSQGSSFVGNTASSEGGGLEDAGCCDATVSLTNTTVAKNSAAYGGGVYLAADDAATDLINDTIYDNSAGAAGQGGGIYPTSDLTPNAVGVENTIIADNTDGDCGNGSTPTDISSSEDAGHNLDSDGSCFTGTGAPGDKVKTDPKLAAPADNGGPTVGAPGNTEVLQTDAELSGSPAIDGGSDTNCPATDARGVARPQGASCDIGAFESYLGAGRLTAGSATPTKATAGSPFEIIVDVGDKGPGESSTTTLTDQLASNATLIGADPSQGSCTASGSPVSVKCDFGTIAAGKGATVSIVETVSKAETATNTASVYDDQGSTASTSVKTTVVAASTGKKPKATTGKTKSVKTTSAKLLGTINPGSQSTGYFFEIGKTKRYGTLTRIRNTKTKTVSVSASVTGLAPGTTYHYRLVAINDKGTSYGKDRTLKTKK